MAVVDAPPALRARDRAVSPGAVVAGLVVLALVLRAVLLTDALAGDELFARYDVLDGGPLDVVDRLKAGAFVSPEVSPPLYFLLAWVAHAVIGTDEALRVPSLLASAGTVWLLYALGRRAFSPAAGLMAAAMWTLSPFAIFYGSEARPYAVLACVCAASLLTLLVALERGGVWRWVLAGVTAAAVVYTHYTGVALVVLQAAWAFAFHPAARRPIVVTYVAAAVSFLPWIGQLRTEELFSYAFLAPEDVGDVLQTFAQALPGHPFVLLRILPGNVPLAAFVAASAAAFALVVLGRGRSPATWSAMVRSPRGALLLAAISTPLSLLIFSVLGEYTVFLVRTFSSCLPAAIVLLAGLATGVRPPWARNVLCAVLLGVLALGAARTLDPDARRPDYGTIAGYLDREARPGDLVVHSSVAFPGTATTAVLSRELDRPLAEEFLGPDDGRVWARAARARRVYLLVARAEPWVRARPPASTGLVEVGRGPTARGWTPVDVYVYERRREMIEGTV